MLLAVILLAELKRVISLVDPNQLTYAYVTEQIMKDELKYLTQIPKDIPHNFSVSFLFPKLNWDPAFNDTSSDSFYCFTDKIKRRLQKIYDPDEYVDADAVDVRDFYDGVYIIADFILYFNKKMLWPAWNKTIIATTLFPSQLQSLVDVYILPPINSKYNPIVNYTNNNLDWFSQIENITDMAGEKDTISYFGYYDIPPPPPTYNGPEKFSIPNLVLYGFLGFNGFVILLTLLFWALNGKRESLLLNYWIKGRDDMRRSNIEATPGGV